MEEQQYVSDREKLDFRQIVLDHLDKILGITRKTYEQGIEKKRAYVEAIESLSDVLLPYFDEVMKKEDDVYIKAKDRAAKMLQEAEANDRYDMHNARGQHTARRVVAARKLFQQLNLLMHRQSYLKQAIYTEGDE